MTSEKWRTLAGQILFAAHVFVLVLVVADSRLAIPDWLHVFGRLHPLLLHFPIVVLAMALLLLLVPKLANSTEDARIYGEALLLIGCLTTAFTVIAGLFLAHEPGYDPDEIAWHKWSGLVVFWLSSLLYAFLQNPFPAWQKAGLALTGLALVISGHLGASITHGEGFITAPLAPTTPMVALEEAEVFAHVVMPILENKCISCHKGSKQKGGLRMDTADHLLRGGDSGPIITVGNPGESLMLQRVHLPVEDEEHMPPKGKPQLTEEEIAILEAWVAGGTEINTRLVALQDTSSLYRLAVGQFSAGTKEYTFKAANPNTVKSLNNFYRKVQALGMDSPALSVAYFGKSAFDPKSLAELKDIQEQTISINLNNMPLSDTDLEELAKFNNLELLYLNFTGISGEGLRHMRGLQSLSTLSLSGNPLNEAAVDHLSSMANLRALYLWNTDLTEEQLEKLRKTLPNTKVETGYKDDGTVYQLNPPVIEYNGAFFKDKLEVSLKHAIQGTKIFYTLDGTEPDSSNYTIYETPLEITENTTLKARAFAPGWTGSRSVSAEFIEAQKSPVSYSLKYPPADRYKGDGANSLFDRQKAIPDTWNLNWLGFRFTPLEVEMQFAEPTKVDELALSIWYNSGSWLFPPQEVEVYTRKSEEEDWRLALKHKPKQPSKDDRSALTRIPIPFRSEDLVQMKLVAHPVASLPEWHGGRGQKGWIMVDELIIN